MRGVIGSGGFSALTTAFLLFVVALVTVSLLSSDSPRPFSLLGLPPSLDYVNNPVLQSGPPQPIQVDGNAVVADSPGAAAISAVSGTGVNSPQVTSVDCPGGSCSPSSLEGSLINSITENIAGRVGEIPDEVIKSIGNNGDITNAADESGNIMPSNLVKSLAGSLIKSFIAPSKFLPVQWRATDDKDGPGYEGTTAFQVPGAGQSVNPVQINAKIVFPKPDGEKEAATNPCEASEPTDPCVAAQPKSFSEKDMQVRLQALRQRVDERLMSARKNWEETVLATKQRYRERMQVLKQRTDALANQIRRLEAGGGARLDLPEYVRVRNRVAGALNTSASLNSSVALDVCCYLHPGSTILERVALGVSLCLHPGLPAICCCFGQWASDSAGIAGLRLLVLAPWTSVQALVR